MNITDVLEQMAQQQGSAPCIYLEDGCWSFQALNESVWKVAVDLHRSGVQRGEVIAHTFDSELALLVTMLASARIGCTVFSVPRDMPTGQRDELLKAIAANWLVSDLPGIHFSTLKSIHISLSTKTDPEQCRPPMLRDGNPSAPWIIVSGSGTTGKPKMMAVTHRQQWVRMEAGLHWLPYSECDVLASFVHLDFYISKLRYLEAFMKGASITLAPNRHLTHEDGHLQSKATVIYGSVFHVEQILKSLPAKSKGFAEGLSALMIGGSTVSASLRKRVCERLCTKLYILYGANESNTTCRTDLTDVIRLPGNVGRPHPGFALQIVDAKDVPLRPLQVGQVRIQSDAMIDGYLNDAPSTARAFRNGWFYPGDLGQLTPDGQLIHMGRADDMMIMNGINIYPLEIEQVMSAHPAVQDGAAMPLKHAIHQDIPVCVVTLFQKGQVTERDLAAYARERLGAHAPRRIIIVDAIPRNQQGKPMRADLLALVMEQLAVSPKSVPTQPCGGSLVKRIC